MNITLVIIVCLIVASTFAFLIFRQSKLAAAGFGLACIFAALFFAFGFLASFEPSANGNWAFKIGYPILFIIAGLGAIKATKILLIKRV